DRVEAHQRTVRAGPQNVAEDQMPEPRGVHRGRVERTRGHTPPTRLVAARLLHAGWQADLRRSGRHWDAGQGTGEVVAEAAAARHRQDAAQRTSSTRQPVRIAARLVAGALGETRDGRRGELSMWTEDGLLRQVVYLGEREDKAPANVRRNRP